MHFDPGSTEEYSNTNYALLPLIVEKVTGKSYRFLLSKYVLETTDLNRTRIFNSIDGDYLANFAQRHTFNILNGVEDVRNRADFRFGASIGSVLGDGSLYSTLGDLVKFDTALRVGKLLNKKSIKMSINPQLNCYSFGWQIREIDNSGKVVYHYGKFDGSRVRFHRLPEEGLSIITLANISEQQYTVLMKRIYQKRFSNCSLITKHIPCILGI